MIKEKDTLKERVEAALEKIKPALQADGGNVELVEVTSWNSKSKINRCLLWLPDESDDLKDGHRQDFKKGSS